MGRALPPVALALAAVVFLLATRTVVAADPWLPRREAAAAAGAMAQRLPPGASVLVIGEPPVAFYLHRAGHPSFGGVENARILDTLGPTYLVTGIYTQRAPGLRRRMARMAPSLTLLGRYRFVPGDVRLMDDSRARDAARFRRHPDDRYQLTLYWYAGRDTTAARAAAGAGVGTGGR